VTQACSEIRATPDGTADRGVSQLASDHASNARGRLRLTDSERLILLTRARSRTLALRIVLRSRIVLLAADGVARSEIARRLGTTAKTTALWVRRFDVGGLDALEKDALGRGRKRSIPPEVVDAVRAAAKSRLPVREIARRTGISPASVVRLSHIDGR
jgi:transposase-like protein